MAFWSVAAVLTLGVTGLLITAALRAKTAGAAASAQDVRIYRDQLAEIDRDLARGTLEPAEAQRARTEIARRLLEADRKSGAVAAATVAPRSAWLVAVLIALAMAGGVAFYARTGLPWYPDMPIAERLAQADADMRARPAQADYVAKLPPLQAPEPDAEFKELMEKLRAAVDPATATDPRGLELLARNEASLGNFDVAATAQRRLIEVKGDAATAEDHGALAEILIAQAQRYVSPEAEAALTRCLQLDPKNGPARYYAGLMFAQGGRYDRAFLLWDPLLAESPADAPWVPAIRAEIEQVAQLAGISYALPPLKGPSAGDVEAAADMSPEDRQAMIEGMVAQLQDRLASQGGSAEEWAQLIRALGMLGRLEEAQKIYAEAKTQFQGRAAELAVVEQAAAAVDLAP